MSDGILEERGDYRVRIVADEYADEPYDDSQSPLLRLDGRHTKFVDSGTMRPRDDDDSVIAAIEHWNTAPSDRDWRLFEKYLRAFYGVTQIETWNSGSYWYVTYDSKAWRDAVGAPAGTADMSEYQAWCEGEAYSWVVEKRVMWSTTDAFDDMATWETVDECSGYYGYTDYLKTTALEALSSQAGDRA